MNKQMLKNIEDELMCTKVKQDVLGELYREIKTQYENRDLLTELTDLKDEFFSSEITLNGRKINEFPNVTQEIIKVGILTAILMISKEVNENDNKH